MYSVHIFSFIDIDLLKNQVLNIEFESNLKI